MVRPARSAVVAMVVVLSIGVPTGIVIGADAGPMIVTSVNGNEVPHGERVVVKEATLTIRVTADARLDTVVIRNDGATIGTFSPAGTTFERTWDEQEAADVLNARDNTIQVIATTVNDETESHRITIYRDTVPPDIGLSSPFTVQPGYVFPQTVTDVGVNVTVRGTVLDASRITAFEARLVANGHSQRISMENGTFSTNTTLALGNTTLVIRAVDAFGNRRIVTTRIYVTDEEKPTIAVENWPANTTAGTITATVRASDDVGIESIVVRPEGQMAFRVLEPPTTFLGKGRDQVRREVTVDLRSPGTINVTFNATDGANHTTEIEKSVAYDPITAEEAAAPEIVVHNASSGFVNDETYALSAVVKNGSVTRVVVEAESIPEGSIPYYNVVYDGAATSRIEIDRNVSVEPGATVLTIRVTDEFGHVHQRTVRIDSRVESQALRTATRTAENETMGTTGGREPVGTTAPPTTATTGSTPVATVTVATESPLEPKTETSVPMSPSTPVLAILASALLLRVRSKGQ
ncbi:MAG: hypothetical protein ABEJ44_01065 [Halanaeroarchaeum sp.]